MLKKLTILAVSTLLLSGCDRSAVGDVSLGLFTMKDKPMFTNTITQQF
ncbi:hypothetical protein MRL64_17845 [bacterium 19MO02SH05]|uniref:Lipoprotein n=1 Tax=bacterium 19MO02SH05 TaxID=2920696 RepID=A0AAU6TMF1_UNCXX